MVGKEQVSQRNRIGQGLVILLGLLCVSIPLYGQQASAWQITPDRIVVGELDRVRAVCMVDRPWSGSLRVILPPEKEGYYYLSDPLIEEIQEGEHFGKTQISLTLRAVQRGLYLLEPLVLVDALGKETVLPPLILSFLRYDEKNYRYPLDVSWAGDLPRQAYVGQPVYLVLVLKNTREILVPDSIRFPSPDKGVLKQEDFSPPIEPVSFGPVRLYSVPVAVWVLTPTETGTLVIPSARVQIGNLERATDTQPIEILPLPRELEGSGAIGSFRVGLKSSGESVAQGDYLTLSVSVEGSGNLHYLKVPEPVFQAAENWKLISVSEENSLIPASGGYSGFRTVHYRYQCLKSGTFQVGTAPFLYLNPLTGGIQSALDNPVLVSVQQADGNGPDAEGKETLVRLPLEAGSLAVYDLQLGHRNPLLLIFLLPGIFLLVYYFLGKWGLKKNVLKALLIVLFFLMGVVFLSYMGMHFITQRDELTGLLEKGNAAYVHGDASSALYYYREAELRAPEHPALLYNLALASHAAGDNAEAIYRLRKLLVFRPGDRNAGRFLQELEQMNHLVSETLPVSRINPEIFYLAGLVCWNLFFWFLFRYLVSGRIRMALLGLLNLVLTLVFIAGYFGLDIYRNKPFAVARQQQTEMKRAPSKSASHWLDIRKGTTIRVTADIGDYLLVKTIYGVEGWVRKEDLWYQK